MACVGAVELGFDVEVEVFVEDVDVYKKSDQHLKSDLTSVSKSERLNHLPRRLGSTFVVLGAPSQVPNNGWHPVPQYTDVPPQ